MKLNDLSLSCPIPCFVYAILWLTTLSAAAQQQDPLTFPSAPNASKGSYQYAVDMLKLDTAWQLTRGRAHIVAVDNGMLNHPELQPGMDGNFRIHLSNYQPQTSDLVAHAVRTMGVIAARGGNGQGISGACPWCSVSLEAAKLGVGPSTVSQALTTGATVINMSYGLPVSGDSVPVSCASGYPDPDCQALARAAERDVVLVSIAGNESNSGAPSASDRIPYPANHPAVIAVGGVESDGSFWTHGYETTNTGSNWGPKMRLVAPAKDVLILSGSGNYGGLDSRCGNRVDSSVSEGPTLPASYDGYGTCNGTSFSGPFVSAIAGLMRSANPLLSAADVQTILYETATRPVPGPTGSGLTFYIPDAGAAVQRALGGNARNRVTPMFSLYAEARQAHLFTSSPQAALAAIAGELKLPQHEVAAVYAGFGDPVAAYPRFTGKLCDTQGQHCTQPETRALFGVFSTEHSPLSTHTLVPLYRMSQVCTAGSSGCKAVRTYAYASSRAQVQALEARGYVVDEVEGYVYPPDQPPPADTTRLCLAFDAARIDHILYAAPDCNRTQLANAADQNTGGNYQFAAMLGYAPKLSSCTANYQDVWWGGASQNGWGLNIAQHCNLLVAGFYLYGPDNQATWLIMQGGTWDAAFKTFTGPLGQPVSGAPFSNYDPLQLNLATSVGTLTFNFADINNATMTYVVNGVTGTHPISRLQYGSGIGSGTSYADVWWGGPTQNGWGVAIAEQGATLVAAWYTFGSNGKPIWYILGGGGSWINDKTYRGPLSTGTGSPLIGANYNAAAFSQRTVGEATFTFADTNSGTMAYTVDGITQTKTITRLQY